MPSGDASAIMVQNGLSGTTNILAIVNCMIVWKFSMKLVITGLEFISSFVLILRGFILRPIL